MEILKMCLSVVRELLLTQELTDTGGGPWPEPWAFHIEEMRMSSLMPVSPDCGRSFLQFHRRCPIEPDLGTSGSPVLTEWVLWYQAAATAYCLFAFTAKTVPCTEGAGHLLAS